MTLTIWKLPLKAADVQEIKIPDGALILTAREQGGDICVWFRCDPSRPAKPRTIAVCGTGHPAPSAEEARYIGTAFLGAFVFHVFERIAPNAEENAA